MKFTAILILSVIMFSMMPTISYAATISEKIRTGEITQVEDGEVQTDTVACFQALYACGKWGYDMYIALAAEDFNTIVTLVAQVQTLLTEVSTSCVSSF